MVNLSKPAKYYLPMLLAILAAAEPGVAAHPRIAEDLNGIDPASSVNIIVQYRTAPTPAHHKNIFNRGGRLNRALGQINASAYRVPAMALESLANDSEVVHISADHELQSAGSTLDFHDE